MKKIFLLIFLIWADYASAQSLQKNDTLDLICRKWKPYVIDGNTINEIDSVAREAFKDASVTFFKDGTYTSYVRDTAVEKGNWKYMSANRRVVCTPLEHVDLTILEIESISKDEIKGKTFPDNRSKKIAFTLLAIK